MEINLFFYTFSTIAQVLAGAFGFLVAVVGYRLQILRTAMEGVLEKVKRERNLKDPQSFDFSIGENWELEIETPYTPPPESGLTGKYKQVTSGSYSQLDDSTKIYIDFYFERVKGIQKDLQRSLTATGPTIGAALVLLPLSTVLASIPWLGCVSLVAILAAALYSLWTFYPIIKGITR